MKIKNIMLGCLGLLSLTACNDYLDVDAPSSNTTEQVYSSATEMNKALNGVYAKILSDNTFGRYLYNDLQLNSDVDFSANSNENANNNSPRRFDITPDGGTTERLWNALYEAVETANEFIYNAEHSSIYNAQHPDYNNITQMVGEAKVIRAMCFYELLCYYGDIPFTFEPTYQTKNFLPDVTGRDEVYTQVIADLKAAAPLMKSVNAVDQGIERVTKEACWAMISRMALQAGGYSLRPGTSPNSYGTMARPDNYTQFYEVARAYADSVIQSKTHSLAKSYSQVFLDECNFIVSNNDDPIFEIPFAKASTGQWGYYQGPQAQSTEGVTSHIYGEANGGARSGAFYRYTFDEKDLRRDYVTGLWYYASTGLPTMRADYTIHNNKWSKLWNTNGLGNNTKGSTGINFAYLRYADVLLMFAEAENELNGPTEEAKAALKTVRERAFNPIDYSDKVNAYVDSVASSKESFLNAVLDERKWELAGENSRWKDLVRNNKYAETLFYTFLRYYSVAENAGGTSSTLDMVEEYDGIQWSEVLPYNIFSCIIQNPGDGNLYPNKTLALRYVVNPYHAGTVPQVSPATYMEQQGLPYTVLSDKDVTGLPNANSTPSWTQTDYYNWWQDAGYPKAQVMYSLYGYIRSNESGNIYIVRDGVAEVINPLGYNVNQLPAVRYLLPYPEEAIARSAGKYSQNYGY
jgi:hypothetical protein